MVNSVLEGATARPEGDLVAMYAAANWDGAYFSETFHGTENYVCFVLPSGQAKAINLDTGAVCTVTDTSSGAAATYWATGAAPPKNKMRAQVVDDFTFITNKAVTPAMANSPTGAAAPNEALVFVRATSFGTTYSVGVTTTDGSNLSASAGRTTSATVVDPTATIASALAASIHGVNGYTCAVLGSIFIIARSDGRPFSINASDGNGDDYLRVFKDQVSSIDRLPLKGYPGFKIKVIGEKLNGDDNYWVQFAGDASTGYWQEVVAPAIKTTIDGTTMPHVMVCTNLNTFEVRKPIWGTRIAGDGVDTAKDPGFIGKPIVDVTYYQRRLGMIWQGGSVFSKTDNPYSFFPDTVQTVLATAPIDTKVAGGSRKGPPILDFAMQFNESIYLWSQKEQFRVESGTEPFKQDTVEVKAAMAYEYAPLSKPAPVGSFLFMGVDVGKWATMKVLQFANGKGAGDTDVLAHAPKYIPKGIREITSNDSLRTIFVQTDGKRTSLYLFNWTYSGSDGFIQTAINEWRIPGGNILWCSQNGNMLRVLQQRPEGVALLSFNLSPQLTDDDAGALYRTRLDIRCTEAQVTGLAYNATTKTSSFTLPYTPTGTDVNPLRLALRVDNATYSRGREYKIISVVGAVVTVQGNLVGSFFYIGQQINAERTESRFFIRSDNGPEPVDEITVNRYKVSMDNTAYTRIEMTHRGEVSTQSFEGRVLGSPSGVTGTPAPQDTTLDIAIEAKSSDFSIRLVNDHFLPSSWQNVSWDFDAVGWKGAK
jgi:hypothetical protein